MNFSNIIRGIGGEPEIVRTLGVAGVASYIVSALVFESWTVFWQGKPFDVTAFCVAFPSGLGVAIGAIAGSAAVKDRNVSVAKVVQDSGSQPGSATPAEPIEATIINKPDEPVPTTTKDKGK